MKKGEGNGPKDSEALSGAVYPGSDAKPNQWKLDHQGPESKCHQVENKKANNLEKITESSREPAQNQQTEKGFGPTPSEKERRT